MFENSSYKKKKKKEEEKKNIKNTQYNMSHINL
jgi:hypothetical protein